MYITAVSLVTQQREYQNNKVTITRWYISRHNLSNITNPIFEEISNLFFFIDIPVSGHMFFYLYCSSYVSYWLVCVVFYIQFNCFIIQNLFPSLSWVMRYSLSRHVCQFHKKTQQNRISTTPVNNGITRLNRGRVGPHYKGTIVPICSKVIVIKWLNEFIASSLQMLWG